MLPNKLQIFLIFFIIIILLKFKSLIVIDTTILIIIFITGCISLSSDTLFEPFETSNEAVQTVSSIYNSGNMSVSNLRVTGNLIVDGDCKGGSLTTGAFKLSGEGDNLVLRNGTNTDWINVIDKTGTINSKNNLHIAGTTNTANLNATGTSNLANWRIKNDRIGIPGRGDLYFSTDKWLKMFDFDTDNYGGLGYAGNNLYAIDTTHSSSFKTFGWRIGSSGENLVFKYDASPKWNFGMKPKNQEDWL